MGGHAAGALMVHSGDRALSSAGRTRTVAAGRAWWRGGSALRLPGRARSPWTRPRRTWGWEGGSRPARWRG